MKIDVTVHIHPQDSTLAATIQSIHGALKTMTAQLQALQAQVAKNTEIEESAVTLIKGLAQQITDSKDDPAALQALADSLTTSANDLSGAITANTPAAPAV